MLPVVIGSCLLRQFRLPALAIDGCRKCCVVPLNQYVHDYTRNCLDQTYMYIQTFWLKLTIGMSEMNSSREFFAILGTY